MANRNDEALSGQVCGEFDSQGRLLIDTPMEADIWAAAFGATYADLYPSRANLPKMEPAEAVDHSRSIRGACIAAGNGAVLLYRWEVQS